MRNTPPPNAIALAGLLSLAVAMGIGRFAFTPMLPLMAREGQLDLAWGGWLAAANYAGYFAGALTAARLPLDARRLALLALALTAVLTAAMALPSLPLWMLLRFAAGAASAWVFVATSVWCLGALARGGRPDLGGRVYAGVGVGIALAGLHGLGASAAGVRAAPLWLQLGALAVLLSLPVVWVTTALAPSSAPAQATGTQGATPAGDTRGLTLCYGLMGFGYILPATYLPALARGVIDDPRWFGLAWPVFGATAAISTLLSGWLFRSFGRLRVWAACQCVMGVGALLPSLWLNGASIAMSALLVGGTFMVITLAGVQEMRARAPADAGRLVGRITAAFALGQIAGPVVSALLLQLPLAPQRGLALALQAAALVLFASAAWIWRRTAPGTSRKETAHA